MKGDLDGVRFILDYADPFVILSEDGNVNVPIPESLFESALCAAGLRNGDSKPFSKWLAQGIEQFRPITEEEDNALQEAVATITAGSDGSVSVSVDTGVEGGEGGEESQIDIVGVGGEIGDEAGEFGDEDNEVGGEFGGAGEPNEMQPVTDQGIEPEAEGPEAVADEMPNFEADNTPEPEEPEEEIEGEEKIVEDKDITDPKKSDYDTTKQDHRDLPKEKGAQKPKGKGKELEGFDSNGKVDVSVKDAAGLKPVKAGENRI